jgi:hypothetical protein
MVERAGPEEHGGEQRWDAAAPSRKRGGSHDDLRECHALLSRMERRAYRWLRQKPQSAACSQVTWRVGRSGGGHANEVRRWRRVPGGISASHGGDDRSGEASSGLWVLLVFWLRGNWPGKSSTSLSHCASGTLGNAHISVRQIGG